MTRVLSATCAALSSVIFVTTAITYIVQRGDPEWRQRVPYFAALYRVEHSDLPAHRKFSTASPVLRLRGAGNRADGGAMLAALADGVGCNRTGAAAESPRCECLLRAYEREMDFGSLGSLELPARWDAFRGAAEPCFALRGAYEVRLSGGSKATVVFDLVLFWWFLSTLLSIALASRALRSPTAKDVAMPLLYIVVVVLGLWVLAGAAHDNGVYIALAIAFWHAGLVPSLLTRLLTVATDAFVPGGALTKNEEGTDTKRGWTAQHPFVQHNAALAATSGVGLAVAQRLVLLFSGHNDATENWGVLWLCVFAGLCSFLLRALQAAVEAGGRADGEAQRTYAFAGWWTWAVLVGTVLLLLLAFPQDLLGEFTASLTAARAAVGAFLVLFALQTPALRAGADAQIAFFHVFEGLARLLALVPLWFYLLG